MAEEPSLKEGQTSKKRLFIPPTPPNEIPTHEADSKRRKNAKIEKDIVEISTLSTIKDEEKDLLSDKAQVVEISASGGGVPQKQSPFPMFLSLLLLITLLIYYILKFVLGS